jgi:hypothetical protein
MSSLPPDVIFLSFFSFFLEPLLCVPASCFSTDLDFS